MLNDRLKNMLITRPYMQSALSCEIGLRQSSSRFLPIGFLNRNITWILMTKKILKKDIFLIQICTTKHFFLILLKIQCINYLLISRFLASATQANYSHKFISEILWGMSNYDKIKLQIKMRKFDLDFSQGTCGKNLKENHRK